MHCVIIGFALHDTAEKRIFDYETRRPRPHEIKAKNINPYLVDAPDVIIIQENHDRYAMFLKSILAISQ